MSTEDDDIVVKRMAGLITGTAMQVKARRIVFKYVTEQLEKKWKESQLARTSEFEIRDVYVVWFSKTLQNWKALLNTTLPDGMYYEVIYDGDRKRSYLDVYSRSDNIIVLDRDL